MPILGGVIASPSVSGTSAIGSETVTGGTVYETVDGSVAPTQFPALYPADDLYPSDTLYPGGGVYRGSTAELPDTPGTAIPSDLRSVIGSVG